MRHEDAAPGRYTRGAIAFHWIIAAAIVLNLALGVSAAWSTGDTHRAVLDLHKPLGLSILLLSLARVGWRLFHRPPPAVPGKAWEAALKHVVHLGFYLLMLAIPLTGWWLSSAVPMRHPIGFFGLFDAPFLPVSQAMSVAGTVHGVHEWLAIAMAVLLALHLAAVAKHQFLFRDHLLARMGVGAA